MRVILVFIGIIFFIFGSLGSAIFAFEQIYGNRVYPGVQLSHLEISGKTKEDVVSSLENFQETLVSDGLHFKLGDKEVVVPASFISLSPQDIAERAFRIGREGSFLPRLFDQAAMMFQEKTLDTNLLVDGEGIKRVLQEKFRDFENLPRSPHVVFRNGDLGITPMEEGSTLNIDPALVTLQDNLSKLHNVPVFLSLASIPPDITNEEAQTALPQAKAILDKGVLTLSFESQALPNGGASQPVNKWVFKQEEIGSWITFTKNGSGVTPVIDFAAVTKSLEPIANEIKQAPQEPLLTIENGKVTAFVAPKNGRALNVDATILALETELLHGTNRNVSLVVDEVKPAGTLQDNSGFGIKELVAEGRSNFKGSPVNRRKNIATGAKKLNGILIKPGEEFSLVGALGSVDEEHGYLPELVIKGNRTIPEFGGGLCQIATTMFRVALNAGVPIVERTAHSFRVRYYEPAGIDATIYDPSPDFRFLNDTPAYLLLTTEIQGNDLVFQFWGTSDGRKVSLSKPKIFNIVPPGPDQTIESTDLKPGEQKCVEHPVPGAQASFTRTIILPTGEKKEETWNSRYKPWPKVCLVGKKPEEVTPQASPPVVTPELPDLIHPGT